jgi:Ca2+-binding RTX toxin-like protein
MRQIASPSLAQGPRRDASRALEASPRPPRRPPAPDNSSPLNLVGTEAPEVLVGDTSNNTYLAAGGDDTVIGSAGNDTISGGSGTDTLSYSNTPGPITLNRGGSVAKPGGGIDTIPDFSIETVIGAQGQRNRIDGSGGVTASLDVDLSQERLTINGLPGVGSASITVRQFTDVIGADKADILTGSAQANDLNGAGGDDIVTGLGGADRLTGGSGVDLFRFAPGDSSVNGYDLITDLAIGEDRIMVGGSASLVQGLGSIASLSREDLTKLLSTTTFVASSAASFSVGARSFLAINDGSAGFQGSMDTLIEITGYSGNLSALTIG